MKNIVLIIPYYGKKLPSYSKSWLVSAEWNSDVDFIVITDIKIEIPLPKNIHLMKITFEELKELIQEKFDFKIAIKNPYKLCDYRPAYGFIFSKLIKGYDYWGYCDIDLVFGNMRKYFNNSVLCNYDRILYLGHTSLYKNTSKINEAFKLDGALFNYRTVYSKDEHFAFDEITGVDAILKKNGISTYREKIYADIDVKYNSMILNGKNFNYTYQIFYWEKGHIYRAYINRENKREIEEFLYLHFQKKQPVYLIDNSKTVDSFVITPDKIVARKPGLPDHKEIKKYADKLLSSKLKKQKYNYLKQKIKQFFEISHEKRLIWIKQKVFVKIKGKE